LRFSRADRRGSERHDWEKVSRTEYGVESAAIPDRLSDLNLNDGLGSRGID